MLGGGERMEKEKKLKKSNKGTESRENKYTV